MINVKKNKTMIRNFLMIILIILFYSCKKETELSPDVSGKFSFFRVETLKSTPSDSATNQASFNLDTVKSSKSFYFILSNSGEKDISNISITTDNENFSIAPSTVSLLPGKNNSENPGLSQVISLDIIHGIRLDGVGYGKLLPKGKNYSLITISGTTNNGNVDTIISLTVKVEVFAKVMDISLSGKKGEIDLSRADGTVSIQHHGFYSMFFYSFYDSTVNIENTGNTEIMMNLLHQTDSPPFYDTIQSVRLYPDDIFTIELPIVNISPLYFFTLDSQGTICDPQRICLGNDGIGYVGLLFPISYK
jgi:hypothetical protein